jgi:predicted nucleotidyltransferase
MGLTVDEIINAVCKIILGEIKPERILLFGSQANGTATDRADIDIGIIAESVPPKQWFHILEKVEGLSTLRKIDLVNLNNVNSDFRALAIKEGKVLYES